MRPSLTPFVTLSILFHLLILFSWPVYNRAPNFTQIPVMLLPPREEKNDKPARAPREVTDKRPSPQTPAQIARRSSPKIEGTKTIPQEVKRSAPEEIKRPAPEEEKRAAPEPAKKSVPEETKRSGPLLSEEAKREKSGEAETRPATKDDIFNRALPTLKELRPPADWVASGEKERPAPTERAIPLNSREPRYVTYLESVKQAIELEWQYPETALRSGVQGKLLVEFTILGDGRLEEIRVIRSSGFPILDREALRAIQAASPYRPLPPWFGRRFSIIASVEYIDNRLKYGLVP